MSENGIGLAHWLEEYDMSTLLRFPQLMIHKHAYFILSTPTERRKKTLFLGHDDDDLLI
ncbi:predicted protein [Sclerotinia sclerotiorum 1980 UF-70]|uniref:Uncharacterized protein n=1 Tax=Sclerotinia sclerotiorum (strain ATCC 18683 / 1980 / Ss-1) TaxID=665079 RepID=A7F6D0_SCLS1|nr:predicted protein [Sclerotinia sclerotiorum 1980 UF-70]EDN98301.1 predicted protein [Sclerotinia sclerotiorum 1980 UF-70]